MIYELVTPSDPITFIAPNDKVAIACSIVLGNGKAGCNNEKGESLPTIYFFHPDPLSEIEKDLGMPLETFLKENKNDMADCFLSFAYGTISSRKEYDLAVECITDISKLKKFKDEHEDRNRSSMSQWVKSAWKYGEQLKKQTI